MVYAVIMAGGSGTRFWPKSTQEHPKQFLKLFGDNTMLQSTVGRLEGFIPEERCMVVTNDRYVDTVRGQLFKIDPDFIIGEPVARNTAPCVAAAAALLYNRDPDAVMVVLPADHVISDPAAFLKVLQSAVLTAADENVLVTIGITPDRPETGYGYIQLGKRESIEDVPAEVFSVKAFTEKPGPDLARKFLESGDYLWNSGMFIWKAEAILQAFEKHQPEIFRNAEKLMTGMVTQEAVDDFYKACPSLSVDYGIMEKAAESVRVIPGSFGWNDVGTWKAVHELTSKDDNSNAVVSAFTSLQDASGNYIHSESGKLIALVGVENLAVVETESALLICNLDRSQDVKKVVEELKSVEERKKFL